MTIGDLSRSRITRTWRRRAFLTLTVPKEFGGHGFSLGEYAMAGAEIGKYCGATALTFNMHNSSMMWSNFMYDLPNLTEADRAAFAPLARAAISPGGGGTRHLFAADFRGRPELDLQAAADQLPGGGGWLGHQRLQEIRLARRLLRLLFHRLHRAFRGHRAAPRGHDDLRRPQGRAGPVGHRQLGSARHARHQQPRPHAQGCLRHRGRPDDAARHFHQDPAALAAHDGDAVADLYGRGARCAFDFTVAYLARRSRRPAGRPTGACSAPSA